MTYRHTWGEDRVCFHGADGRWQSLPAAWTDIGPADPFVAIAAGRAIFRFEDLLALVRLLGDLGR